MAEKLKGADVVAALNEKMIADVTELKGKGVTPTLAIMRVGENGADISYEKGAMKRCETIGVSVVNVILPADVTQDDYIKKLEELNTDDSVHGILLFRPLPAHISDDLVRKTLNPAKDIDGVTDMSLGGMFSESGVGYPPCTAQACMEILDYYNIECKGKRVTMIGSSLVVGKPAATMLINRWSTVQVCHIFTKDTPAAARNAEILIVAVGKAGLVTKDYLSPGQIVIDVGINVNAEGKLCGDVNAEDAEGIVQAITPVPGGVGTVTTSVLVSHVVDAAKKSLVK